MSHYRNPKNQECLKEKSLVYLMVKSSKVRRNWTQESEKGMVKNLETSYKETHHMSGGLDPHQAAFLSLTAQTLYSGILAIGSNAGFVRILALLSRK